MYEVGLLKNQGRCEEGKKVRAGSTEAATKHFVEYAQPLRNGECGGE